MKKLLITGILIIVCFFVTKLQAQPGEEYFAGGTLGTPGLLNLNIAGYKNNFGTKVTFSLVNVFSAAYALIYEIEDHKPDKDEYTYIFAGQVNFEFKFYKNRYLFLTAGPALGCFIGVKARGGNNIYAGYAGAACGLILKGFFLEIGVAYGFGDNYNALPWKVNVVPLVQIGYLWRIK